MRYFLVIAGVLGIASAAAQAHGPQLQITNDNNKIVAREIYLDGPYAALSDPKSAYVLPLLEFNGSWYARPNTELDLIGNPSFFSGPGLAYGAGQTFAAGESFSWNFADGLKLWDGDSFEDPGATQLQSFRGDPSAPTAEAFTTDSGPFGSLAFAAISPGYSEEAHSGVRFRLLGDGTDPTSASPDGVYRLTMQIATSQAGVAPSDAFDFILVKNAPFETMAAAVQSLGVGSATVQFLVPEPTGFVLAIVGFAALVCRPHRRRRA